MRPGRSTRLTRSGKAAGRPLQQAPFPHRQSGIPLPLQGRAAPSGGFSCPASGKRYPFSRPGGSGNPGTFSRPGGSGNPGTPHTAKGHHTIGTPPPCALIPPVRAFSRTVASASAYPARPLLRPFPAPANRRPLPRKAGRYHPAAFPALQAGSGIRFPDRAAPAIPASLKRQKGIIRLEPPPCAGAQCPANPFGEGRLSKRFSRTPLLRRFAAPANRRPLPPQGRAASSGGWEKALPRPFFRPAKPARAFVCKFLRKPIDFRKQILYTMLCWNKRWSLS